MAWGRQVAEVNLVRRDVRCDRFRRQGVEGMKQEEGGIENKVRGKRKQA